jgi:hypothetical protein
LDICCFTKKNRSNNQLIDNSIFDHSSVKNLWIEIGKNCYPQEPWNLEWGRDAYGLAHRAFQDFKEVYKTSSIPYVGIKDLKNLFPIFSIKLVEQPESISCIKNNTVLHAEFNNHVPEPTGTDEGTICYIIIVSKCVLCYELTKNTNTRILNSFFYFYRIFL